MLDSSSMDMTSLRHSLAYLAAPTDEIIEEGEKFISQIDETVDYAVSIFDESGNCWRSELIRRMAAFSRKPLKKPAFIIVKPDGSEMAECPGVEGSLPRLASAMRLDAAVRFAAGASSETCTASPSRARTGYSRCRCCVSTSGACPTSRGAGLGHNGSNEAVECPFQAWVREAPGDGDCHRLHSSRMVVL